MSQLSVRRKLPLGLAWNWVKFSFATFREKPINFLAFSLVFVIFSLTPFIGSFLSVLILARIYLSADKVNQNINFGLEIGLAEIFRQRNIFNYGLFNTFFDFLLMGVFQEALLALKVENTPVAMMNDHRVALILFGLSLFRILFFGISLGICIFNPEIKFFQSLLISWRFVLRHISLVLLSLFLLIPFLVIPLYLSTVVVLSVNSSLLFILATLFMLLVVLIFIAITTIFSYKLYKDGIETNE